MLGVRELMYQSCFLVYYMLPSNTAGHVMRRGHIKDSGDDEWHIGNKLRFSVGNKSSNNLNIVHEVVMESMHE